ncbi:MAG: hypothetical protein R3D02_11055 [Hyphomicrobiales bacterium]
MKTPIRAIAIAASLLGTAMSVAPLAADEIPGFVWEAVSGESVPATAYSGAIDGSAPTHLCRVINRQDVEIGYLGEVFCQIGGDGMNRPYSIFQVLTVAPGVDWARAEGSKAPAASVNFSNGRGPDSFACRFPHDEATLVGTLRDGFCHAGFKDTELQSDAFDVLVWADGKGPAK